MKNILTPIILSLALLATPAMAREVHGGGEHRGPAHFERHDGYRRGYDGGAFLPGLIIGGIVGTTAAVVTAPFYFGGIQYHDHVDYCLARFGVTYNSFDNTYLGDDGYRHVCP